MIADDTPAHSAFSKNNIILACYRFLSLINMSLHHSYVVNLQYSSITIYCSIPHSKSVQVNFKSGLTKSIIKQIKIVRYKLC